MACRLSPDSVDPFILAYAAKLWTIAGLILTGAGLIAVIATVISTSWSVALMPLGIFLPAAVASFWQRWRLRAGKSVPESIAARFQRALPCEIVRLLIWLIAIGAFLLWGLSGGWSLAWLVFVAAGMTEWLLDRLFSRRCS